jgi:O-antigen/teichoic acid export membrane protein
VSKNALALLVAQVGARALNLVLVAMVTRALGAEGLGRYLMAMTVQTLALAVCDLGLSTYTTREFSREGESAAGGLWGTVLSLKIVAALCTVLVLNALIAPFFPGRQSLLAFASLSLLPDAFNGLVTAWIKARQRMEVSAAVQLGTRLAYTVAGALCLWRGLDERALLAAYGGASVLGSLAYGLVLRRWSPGLLPGSEGEREETRERTTGLCVYTRGYLARWGAVLGESAPFAITGIVAMLYARADLLILSFARGDAAAGRYGMAYRLFEVMGMIPASFLDALFPELSRLGGRGVDLRRLRALYRRGWLIVGAGGVLLALAAQAVAKTLVALLYGRTADAAFAVGLLRVLLFAFPFTYLYLLNGHVLYAVGEQRRVTVAMVFATAAKLLLNAWLVPIWGVWGTAGVALASELLLFAWLQGLVRWAVLRPWPTEAGDHGSVAE